MSRNNNSKYWFKKSFINHIIHSIVGHELVGDCFEYDKEYTGEYATENGQTKNPILVNDHEKCRAACKKLSSCNFFTFRNGNQCVLMKEKAHDDPKPRDQNLRHRFVSGSKQDCSKGTKFVYLWLYFIKVNYFEKCILTIVFTFAGSGQINSERHKRNLRQGSGGK